MNKNRLTPEGIKRALQAYNERDEDVLTKGKPSMAKAAKLWADDCESSCYRYWDTLMEEAPEGADEVILKAYMKDAIKGLVLDKVGNPLFRTQSVLSEDECLLVYAKIEFYSDCGFPLDVRTLREELETMAVAKLEEMKTKKQIDFYTEADIPKFGDSFCYGYR